MRNQSSETTTTTVNEPKWSIKEKLYLVSSVMVNGDSNWNYVCDNLNRFVAQTTPNVSSRSLPRRTNIQCSKQYRQIVKQYTPKNGALCDLKKVYDQLKNERLTELKRQIQASRQEYNKLCTEIEQILALNSPENFLFLSQKWCNLKAQIETRRKPAVAAMFGDNDWVPTPLSNQLSSSEIEHILELVRSIAAASNLDTAREVETNRNIERLLAFELKKVRAREEAEAAAAAAELERKKRLEEEAAAAAAEAAAAAAAAEAAAALESAMEVDEQSVKVEATSSSPDKKTERKSVESATTKTNRVEIKLESQDEEDLEKAARQTSTTTTTTSTVVKADADSYSSEDEPLLEIKNRQTSIHQQLSQTSASEEAAAAAKQSPSSGRPSRAGASKSRSSISVAPPTPAAAATPNTHRTRSSSKLNTAAAAATATAADSSSTTSSSHISSDEDKQPTNPVTSTSKTSARQTPVSSPSKQQQLTPTRQLTPRRHLLSSGEEPTTTGSDIVYAPQLSKESKMSIYDLDNDDVETGKSGSVQVFDLGESASVDDKLSKLSKIGPASKGSPASSTASTSTKPQRASRQTSSQKLAQTTTASEESTTGAAAQTSSTSVQESQSGEGIEQATPTSEGTRTISLRSNKRNQQQQQQQSTPPPAKTTRKSTANLRQQQKQLDESTSKGASVSSPPPSVGESSLGGSNLVSIIKEEPIHISTTGGGGDTTAPFSSSSSASSSTSTSSSAAATAAAIVGGKFEDEKAYRAWKKSIMMALNNIACHKHATIFMHPVKDEIAPGYSSVVHRPMDLSTLKRMIESGTIKSTKEFQRDIMLMFTNAIMYNSSSHDVHKISVEMYKEVLNDIEQLLNAQEASGEDSNKPLRFKDIRSSTASERGAGGDNDRNDANESTNEIPVVNLLMKSKKEQPKEEAHNLETASLKSNSTISTPLTSNSNSNSNTRSKRGKAATAAAAATSQPAETTPKSTPTAANTRKRRPSITNTPTTPSEKPEPTSTNTTSSKRRKSGR